MELKKYLQSFQGLQIEARFSRAVIFGLLIIVYFYVFTIANRPQIVTIKPWTLTVDAQVTRNAASRSYLKSWGFALAQVLGNVTPANVDFIYDRLAPLLDPKIYHRVMDSLDANARTLKEQRIAIRFEPRRVTYEKSTGKVFVTGYSFMREGSSLSNEKRQERTYEFLSKIDNYAPVILSLDTYQGTAGTRDVLETQDQKERSELARVREREKKESRYANDTANTSTTDESATRLE